MSSQFEFELSPVGMTTLLFDKHMRWLSNNLFPVAIYAIFITSSSIYLHGWLKYRGIESWPSVGAEIVRSGGGSISIPTQSRHGAGTATVDTSFVEFEYSVDGQTYRSKTATPDGGGLSMLVLNDPWKAFYKPSSPDIAVLAPVPFTGERSMIIATLTGIMVLVHFRFTLTYDLLVVLRRKLLG